MEFNIDSLRETFNKLFYEAEPRTYRTVKMYTNAGGYDMFEESMEENLGLKRVYIGQKVPRILRRLKGTIYKSATERYYKLKRV